MLRTSSFTVALDICKRQGLDAACIVKRKGSYFVPEKAQPKKPVSCDLVRKNTMKGIENLCGIQSRIRKDWQAEDFGKDCFVGRTCKW